MKVRDLILHNFRLKLVSLMIAVLVWTTMHLIIQGRFESPRSGVDGSTNQVSP